MSHIQIFLTDNCNLNCSYCFVKEHIEAKNQEFTIENFKKALKYFKTGKKENVLGIIGGEPTIHTKFKEILKILNNDETIDIYTIFTNGINVNKYIDYLRNEKVYILINCNSPQNIGTTNYKRLKDNIQLLTKEKKKNFRLGINLYSKEMDYNYIFELMDLTNEHSLRTSYAICNKEKENTKNILESFKSFKPFLFNFFEKCLKNEIVPYYDCNSIPPCIITKEDKELHDNIRKMAKKYKALDTIYTSRECSNVIGIFPDLTARRSICFPLGEKISISNFKSIETLKEYLYNTVDIYTKLSFVSDDCIDCKYRLINRCGICPVYKLNQYKKIKNYILKKL